MRSKDAVMGLSRPSGPCRYRRRGDKRRVCAHAAVEFAPSRAVDAHSDHMGAPEPGMAHPARQRRSLLGRLDHLISQLGGTVRLPARPSELSRRPVTTTCAKRTGAGRVLVGRAWRCADRHAGAQGRWGAGRWRGGPRRRRRTARRPGVPATKVRSGRWPAAGLRAIGSVGAGNRAWRSTRSAPNTGASAR